MKILAKINSVSDNCEFWISDEKIELTEHPIHCGLLPIKNPSSVSHIIAKKDKDGRIWYNNGSGHHFWGYPSSLYKFEKTPEEYIFLKAIKY